MQKILTRTVASVICIFCSLPAFSIMNQPYASAIFDTLKANGFDTLPGEATNVEVNLKLEPTGAFTIVGIKNENKEQMEPARQVRALLAKVSSFGPLPAVLKDNNYVFMAISWDHQGSNKMVSIGGPFFTHDPSPFSSNPVGTVKAGYTDEIKTRFLRKFSVVNGQGSAVIHLTLGAKGEIKQILISAQDKAKEKLIYDAFAQAHPFGILPKEFSATPYFVVKLNWDMKQGVGSRIPEVEHMTRISK